MKRRLEGSGCELLVQHRPEARAQPVAELGPRRPLGGRRVERDVDEVLPREAVGGGALVAEAVRKEEIKEGKGVFKDLSCSCSSHQNEGSDARGQDLWLAIHLLDA